MHEFIVTTDRLELPRNTWFTTVCKFPYEAGALVVFKIGRRTSIGRWLPNIGGFSWIWQPGGLICLIGRVVRILGQVVGVPLARPCWN